MLNLERTGRTSSVRNGSGADDLRRSALFARLPDAVLSRIVALSRSIVLERGQKLWTQGDQPDHLAVVLSGRLKSVQSYDRRQVIVDIAIRGDVLGDVAFGLHEPYPTTIIALGRAKVLRIPAGVLREAFEGDPRALWSALFSLARRAQRLMRLIDSLSTGDVAHRIAAALLSLVERAGEPFPGGLLVPLRLRRADLAALAATSAESVSRHLSAWQRKGILILQPAGYLIRDLPALHRFTDAKVPEKAGQ